MGLFRSSRAPGDVGRFESPHPPRETLQVLYAGLASQLSVQEFAVTEPGPMAAIYLSRLGVDGITVTAGNSAETYFAFHVDLTPTATGCTGHAYYDRPERQIRRWTGNAIKINAGVQMALHSASARISTWRTG
ncbi:hypothetical protein [Kitasatospora sp. NPDC051914]|uniref:hypothetical protein n=1 Tax=Kitasatospora sp. NPDC051914 TaxID=3154945 RepID=UPI00343AF407